MANGRCLQTIRAAVRVAQTNWRAAKDGIEPATTPSRTLKESRVWRQHFRDRLYPMTSAENKSKFKRLSVPVQSVFFYFNYPFRTNTESRNKGIIVNWKLLDQLNNIHFLISITKFVSTTLTCRQMWNCFCFCKSTN